MSGRKSTLAHCRAKTAVYLDLSAFVLSSLMSRPAV